MGQEGKRGREGERDSEGGGERYREGGIEIARGGRKIQRRVERDGEREQG